MVITHWVKCYEGNKKRFLDETESNQGQLYIGFQGVPLSKEVRVDNEKVPANQKSKERAFPVEGRTNTRKFLMAVKHQPQSCNRDKACWGRGVRTTGRVARDEFRARQE